VLTFEAPDLVRFPALRLAREALAAGAGATAGRSSPSGAAVPGAGPSAALASLIPFIWLICASVKTGDDLFADIHGGEVEDDILSDLDENDGVPRTVVVGSEGLGGPSWQEPTSVEVGADLDRRGPNEGERDVPAAFLTGIVLAGVALGSLMIGKGAFAIVAALLVLVAQGELFGVTVKQHQQPATAVGLVTGALMIAGLAVAYALYFRGTAISLPRLRLAALRSPMRSSSCSGLHFLPLR